MSTENDPTSQVSATRHSMQLAVTVLGQVGLLTLVVVVGSLFGGLWLDRQLGTKPLFIVLLMLGSFPVSLYIIYRVALSAAAKVQLVPKAPAARAKGGVDEA